MRGTFTLLLLAFCTASFAQNRVAIYDLSKDWQVLESGTYVSYADRNSSANTVYFTLDADKFRSYELEIEGARNFSVWINGKLIRQSKAGKERFNIDSLEAIYQTPMTVGVFADRGLSKLRSSVVTFSSVPAGDEDALRPVNYIRDFSVLAIFILCSGFLILLRFNRRMLFDYFDFTRLFSLQERDDSLVAGRITSRFSMLIYFYLSAWCAFLFLVTVQHVPYNWIIVGDFQVGSVSNAFVHWGKLTLIIGVALFIKVSLVLALSIVFRLREGGSIQVLNYFRLVSFLLMIVSVILIFYFVLTTKSPQYYQNLILLSAWIMAGWALLIFLKLLNKSPYSVFHLFSYLCASEFFPIIILYKSLFL
jgi:Domain of unknown function (DUF4271)